MPRRWAYAFVCERPVVQLLADANAGGPWRWVPRESELHQDHLTCTPAPGVKVRIQEQQSTRFRALLHLEEDSDTEHLTIDGIFRRILDGLGAWGLSVIEPYE